MTRSIEDLAYLAGLMDGDGSIVFAPMNNRFYYLNIHVTLTHFPTVKWLHSVFGGSVQNIPSNKLSGRPALRWQASHHLAIKILEPVLPYLHVKKEQGTLALAFATNPIRLGKSEADQKAAEFEVIKIRALNTRKGPPAKYRFNHPSWPLASLKSRERN